MSTAVVAWVAAAIAVGSAIYANNQIPDEQFVGAKVQKRGTKSSRNVAYGTSIVPSVNVYNNIKNSSPRWMCNVFAFGVGQVEEIHQVYHNERALLAFEQSSNQSVNAYFESNSALPQEPSDFVVAFNEQDIKMQFRYGQPTQLASGLAKDFSDGEWGINHRGDRVPHITIVVDRSTAEDVFITSGRYALTAKISGQRVHDPRYHATGVKSFKHLSGVPAENEQCGRNSALCLLDFITDDYYGMAIPWAYIDIPSFEAAANWTDANSIFTDGMVDTSQTFGDCLAQLLSAFQGVLVIQNGLIACKYEDTVLVPYATVFDEDNIIQVRDIVGLSESTYYNMVEIDYKNSLMDEKGDTYQLPGDMNELIPGDTISRQEKDGFIKKINIDMPLTIDNASGSVDGAVKLFANRAYNASNFQRGLTIVIDLAQHPVQIFDVVKITNSVLGYNEKWFRITSITNSSEEENFNQGEIRLIEYDDAIYTGLLDGFAGAQRKWTDSILQAVETLAFNTDNFSTVGYGTLTWDNPNEMNGVEFQVDYKLSSETVWTTLTQVSNNTAKVPNLYATSYDFRVKAVRFGWTSSEYTELLAQVVAWVVDLPAVTGLVYNVQSPDMLFGWDDMSNVAILNTVDPANPDSFGSSGKVVDYFKYYEIDVYHGVTLKETYHTTNPSFTYLYADNEAHGLTRAPKLLIRIVAVDGSQSLDVETTPTNNQMGAPTNVSVVSLVQASTIRWDARSEADFAGTEIHISTTQSFTPSPSTLVQTLQTESSFVFVFPDLDTSDRYCKIAHFDKFGNTGLNYSTEELLLYTSVESANYIYYYIKPLTGTALKNGTGSLLIEAHCVENGVDNLLTDGTIKLWDDTVDHGYSKAFTSADITDSLLITMKDGVGGTILDSITLVDVLDAGASYYGSISASGPLTWVQAKQTAVGVDGAWSPASTSTILTAEFYTEGALDASRVIPFTREADGTFTIGTVTGDVAVTYNVIGAGTPAVTVDFTYANVTVSETIASIIGGSYGDDGDVGVSSKNQFSSDEINWHDEPITGDTHMRACTSTLGAAYVCAGSTLVKGEVGDAVKLQFSDNNSSWHDDPVDGDAYMRSCTNTGGAGWVCSPDSTLVKGEIGNGSKNQFALTNSVNEGDWHDEPVDGDAWMRTCTNVNAGAWVCVGGTLVKGETGDGVKTEFSDDDINWHDAPLTDDIYIRTCNNVNGGAYVCGGSTRIRGFDGDGIKTEFSDDDINWHDAPLTADLYMRTCTSANGAPYVCLGSVLIKGETGQTGNGVKVEFSDDNINWHDAPITGDLWMRSCTNVNGGTWSCDGSTKVAGENGQKGAKHYYITGTVWSDAVATNFVVVSQGDVLVKWDVVTISSEVAPGFVETKYWDPDAGVSGEWTPIGEVIDGSLIVLGSVRASSIDVDDVFAQDITATGTITGASLDAALITGSKLTVGIVGTTKSVVLDSANSESPIYVRDGDEDMLHFVVVNEGQPDERNVLQLSGGLAPETIDSLSVFSDAVLDVIAPPVQGSTGGVYSAASPIYEASSLTEVLTIPAANASDVSVSVLFKDAYFSLSAVYNPPVWNIEINRSINGGSYINLYDANVTGSYNYIAVDGIGEGQLNVAVEYLDDTHTATDNDVVDYQLVLTKVSGGGNNPYLKTFGISQAIQGGGVGGVASSATFPYVGLTNAGSTSYPALTMENDPTSADTWIRTNPQGLLPNVAGGASSSLGTATWEFNNIYGTNVYSNGALVYSSANDNIGTGGSEYAAGNHTHTSFGVLALTGQLTSTTHIIAGDTSGSVSLSINDGKGNANLAFNHFKGIPDLTGNSARIEVNTDSTTGATIGFEIKSGTTVGVDVDLTQVFGMFETYAKTLQLRPFADSTYNIGTTTLAYKNAYIDTVYEGGSTLASKYAAASHTHGTYDYSTTISGAVVFDEIDVTDGIVTNISTRTLTLANLGYTGATNANNYVLPAVISVNEVKTNNGTELVLNAGEASAMLAAEGVTQNGELVYINAENGLQVNSSPTNWGGGSSDWASRNTATICNNSGLSSFPGDVSAPTFTGDLIGNSDTATWADTVDVNSGNTTNATYPLVWHSSDSVFSTALVFINPSLGKVYATEFKATGEIESLTNIQTVTLNNRKIGRVADTASIATIGSDNVMEVGRYVDFHAVGTSVDFSMRLNCNVGELRIEGGDVNIIAGTLTASGDIYSTGTAYFGDAKEIARFSDSWLRLNPADNFTSGIYCGPSTVRTDGKLQVGNNGAFFNVSTAGNVTAAGTITGTDCIATSDRRFKENLVRIENPIEKLNAINGYTFNWVNNPDERVAHTMAQEVQSVYPEAVKEDEAGKLHVSLSAEIALLIEVCKSQQREIDELKRRIT